MTVQVEKETLGFQAEVKQVLNLVIHSLYSNKEIFLRELVSNASDACDKLRFSALSKDDLYGDDSDLKIHISYDEKLKTITVEDNGIGMTREEVISNLGTIAKSGTKEFIANLTGDQTKDSNLIGQFGVGFYSAFIIADNVVVESRRAGSNVDSGIRWQSKGDGEFTLETIKKKSRGTKIILHVKDSAEEFLSNWRLRGIVTKYSDHISWPIVMKALPDLSGKEYAEDVELKDEVVNRATALWAQNRSDISKEQYEELYKHISHDPEPPMSWTHNHVEGKQHYISLLYIPSHAPFDLYHSENKSGLKLYIKRVFIMDEARQFLPNYLRFIKGIVDSSDLPLNVSREILQDNVLVDTIRKSCIKRALSMIERLAESDKEKYQKFWKEFGLVLKEGPIEDYSNREQIAKLMRFSSTHTDNSTPDISLEDYVSRMREGQEKIYYIIGESFNAAKNSPHLEVFRKKGIEVLLLHERIDEWLMNHLGDFQDKSFQSVTKGELDLGELADKEEIEQTKQDEKEFTSLLEQVKSILGEKIKEVRLTHRLTDSPACVVADSSDMSREMQRILKSAGQHVPEAKPIFEINPNHKLIQRLNQEQDDDQFAEWTTLLFEQAILAEGGHLEDPAQFVKRLNQMLIKLAS